MHLRMADCIRNSQVSADIREPIAGFSDVQSSFWSKGNRQVPSTGSPTAKRYEQESREACRDEAINNQQLGDEGTLDLLAGLKDEREILA